MLPRPPYGYVVIRQGIFAFPPARGFVVVSEIAAVGVQTSAELSKDDKALLSADPRFSGIP